MVSRTRPRAGLVSILLLAVFAGCGPSNPLGRQALSGNVTIDGAPLDQGSIEFSPESPSGVASGGLIKGGAYTVPETKGLPPGKYLVRIHSIAEGPTAQGSAAPEPGASTGPQRRERVGAAYNTESRIIVEVRSGQEARFDFETKSRQSRTQQL